MNAGKLHTSFLLLIASCSMLQAQEILLVTGQVESRQAQDVMMPVTTNFQGKISELADEGSWVEPGDMVVRFDGTDVDSRITSAEEDLLLFMASTKRDLIRLEIDLRQAELNEEKARVEQAIAEMLGAVPLDLIGELEYRERQLRLARAENAQKESGEQLTDARQKLTEKQTELELGTERKTQRLNKWRTMLESYTINADQAGYVIHSMHPWNGSKLQEGDQTNSGMQVASVAQNEEMEIVAWVNAVDIPHLVDDQPVTISFDAIDELELNGRISDIELAGDVKPEWGNGLYYRIVVAMPQGNAPELLSGMSVLLEIPLKRSI